MRSQRWRLIYCYLLLSSSPACLRAQTTPASPPPVVTLEQAVQEAVNRNLNLLAERYNLSVAEARIVTARLRPNPVLTVGYDYGDWLRQGFTAENGGGPPEFTSRIDYPIERGRKRENRIAVAENLRSVAQLNLLNTTRQLIFDVTSAFVDVQAAKESVRLAQENLRAFNEIVSVNDTRVKAGDLAPVELMRSRVAALQFQNAERQAELRLRTAQNRLRTLLGRPLTTVLDVQGPIRREALDVPLETVEQQAFELRPDLQALVRDQARSLADLRLQIAQGKVDYSVGVQYHHQTGPARADAFGAFLAVPLPIYNRNQGEILRAQREGQQIEARIRSLRNDIGAEVQTAYDTYRTARAQLENIEKNLLPEATQVRDITQYSYRRGEASLLEFLDAQRAYNDTVQSFNDARADYARSLYLLDTVSGKVVNP